MAVMRVVYVDSGSTDDSVAGARGHGRRTSWCWTPLGRSRRHGRGTRDSSGSARSPPESGWSSSSTAIANFPRAGSGERPRVLDEHREVAAVCGRLRERHPEQSVYNRLADLEWNGPVGEIRACGGVAMILRRGVRGRRRLRSVDHRGRGRRALPADPPARVEDRPDRCRDGDSTTSRCTASANGGDDRPGPGMLTRKGRRCTAIPPNGISSGRRGARSSGGSRPDRRPRPGLANPGDQPRRPGRLSSSSTAGLPLLCPASRLAAGRCPPVRRLDRPRQIPPGRRRGPVLARSIEGRARAPCIEHRDLARAEGPVSR